RSKIIEVLLPRCGYEEINFLWTVVEPTLHRDFMYSSLNAFPMSSFSPVSIPICREVHKKLGKPRYRTWKLHRLSSAILHDEEEVRQWSSQSVLPIVKTPLPLPSRTLKCSLRRLYKSNSCPSMQFPVGRECTKTTCRNRSSSDLNNNSPRLTSIPENAQCIVQWFEERWNGWQRNQFLQLFIRVLEPAELYLLSGMLAVRLYRNFIALLPEHLALRILSYLSPQELLVAAQVNKTWRRMASRNELWLAKCSRIHVGIPLRVPTIWKEIFKQNLSLKRNWANGECRVMDITGHIKNVLSVCEFRDKIASGSLDRSIKIWDAITGSLLMTLQGHTRGVWSLRFLSSTMLISASYDKSIRVWNLRTGICSRILLGHGAPIWAIERKADILISGSGDKTARLWNIRQCKQLRTLFGHTCSVFCVDLDDNATRAFTGSADRTVRIWDVASGACVGIIHAGHSSASAVTAISFDQGHLAVATGTVISLWNLCTGACLQEFKGHKGRIESIRLRFLMVNELKKESGLIVSAGKDSMIKYWDIEEKYDEGSCIQTLRGIKDVVNCIHFDDTRIISASFDGKIRIWDFNQ
ncbi:hypothetical protein QZH41_019558, partial [Actinostola sp. cb2023]